MGTYYGWSVGGMLRFFGFLLLALAILVTAVILINRWRRRHGKGSTTLAVDWTLILCGGAVLVFLISVPLNVIQTMTSRQVILTDFPFTTTLLDNRYPCNESSSGSSGIDCLSVSSGTATLTGLDTGVRTLIAVDQALWALLTVLPAVALGVICFQLLRGIPFARTVTRTLIVSAIAVLVLGIAASMVDGISRGAASAAVLPPDSGGDPISAGGIGVTVPMWPFGAALALVALAAVFRYGAKLQRETEGLV